MVLPAPYGARTPMPMPRRAGLDPAERAIGPARGPRGRHMRRPQEGVSDDDRRAGCCGRRRRRRCAALPSRPARPCACTPRPLPGAVPDRARCAARQCSRAGTDRNAVPRAAAHSWLPVLVRSALLCSAQCVRLCYALQPPEARPFEDPDEDRHFAHLSPGPRNA